MTAVQEAVTHVQKLVNETGLSAETRTNLIETLLKTLITEGSPVTPPTKQDLNGSRGKKSFVRKVVNDNWPDLPNFSTLKNPIVEELQKVPVGCGVVLTFRDSRGIQKAVLVKAGSHYKSGTYDADPEKPTYMFPGGFINLTDTPAIDGLPEIKDKAEDPRRGAVRELEEEIVDENGKPVLRNFDPARLKPIDIQAITHPNGGRLLGVGFTAELTAAEARIITDHAERLEKDDDYRHAVRNHTKAKETGNPEVCTVSILPLKEIVEGKHTLLHKDQMSLFKLLDKHLQQGSGIV